MVKWKEFMLCIQAGLDLSPTCATYCLLSADLETLPILQFSYAHYQLYMQLPGLFILLFCIQKALYCSTLVIKEI